MKININFAQQNFSLPWRAYAAEFLGTFVFVFVASGAVLSNIFFGDVGVLAQSLAAGLALGAMIFMTAAISGGHLNPAVTLSLWLTRKISAINAVFYIVSQVVASFAAGAVLLYVFGDRALGFSLGAPILGADVALAAALVLEAVLTAALVFAVFATTIDKRGPVSFGPLVIGLVVVVAGIFAGPITGAALNPARVIGPAVVSQNFTNLPIWILGPALGSLFGIVYEFLFLRKGTKGK
ncbi:aquaporin [Candidatus Curtissbacteria bacterium]|nr:aquaporin [Candidatus Curtissbacteria bacterium]